MGRLASCVLFVSIQELLNADATAQRYGIRPSALLGVHDEYLAYCIDTAVALAGIDREAQLQQKLTDQTQSPYDGPPMLGPDGIRGKIPFIGKRDP